MKEMIYYSAFCFFPIYYLVWVVMLMNEEFIDKSDAKICLIPPFLLIRFFIRAFAKMKYYNEIKRGK